MEVEREEPPWLAHPVCPPLLIQVARPYNFGFFAAAASSSSPPSASSPSSCLRFSTTRRSYWQPLLK